MFCGISRGENDHSVWGARMDFLMIAGTIAFFLLAVAYTIACDKLK
jgi:hypothetical protein